MQTRMLLTAGAALLALAACSRSNQNANQGITRGAAGLQVNVMSAAIDCMSPSEMNRPMANMSPDERRQIVACVNAATARQINTQLPRQLDEITRLDRITTEGPMLIYHYTVSRPPPPALREQLASRTRTMTCAQPQARQTIEYGGAYGFRWVDSQGGLIQELRIDAC